MAPGSRLNPEEAQSLMTRRPSSIKSPDPEGARRSSSESDSTASLILENINGNASRLEKQKAYRDNEEDGFRHDFHSMHLEDGSLSPFKTRPVDSKYKRILVALVGLAVVGWVAALVLFIMTGSYKHHSTVAHDPSATITVGSGKSITLDQVETGYWRARAHGVSWINGPNDEDGMVLERGGENGRDYLVVEDVRKRSDRQAASDAITLMKQHYFNFDDQTVYPNEVWPSPDLKSVLIMSHRLQNWRHSYTGVYWVFDVETQTAQALDPALPAGRVQLATWSPNSDGIIFTRDNNMFYRKVDPRNSRPTVTALTDNGGENLFNGVPDWVFEEEVFGDNSATWWSQDGKYVAYLATNETNVPEYPIQYFIERPSLTDPPEGEEAYPETRWLKYPKAGAPNPIVHLRFIDIDRLTTFDVPIEDDFTDDDRQITEVIWAGDKVLIRELNRVSTYFKVILIDVTTRTGEVVRKQHVDELKDGGWFEVSETTTFVPKDPENGRPEDGYIDTVIYDGYDHLGYFTPLNSSDPIMLTSGEWEVVDAPSKVDKKNNYVYFVGTKESSIQRHIYKVNLDGSGLEAVTDTSREGYYHASFSTSGSYALLSYNGPNIPWQKVISTPSTNDDFEETIEVNAELAEQAAKHELPLKVYSVLEIDGFKLNAVERRPPHFSPNKKYPVLFYPYGGPGSQTVDKQFTVDFQSYIASLGYIVVTFDGRGTGFLGRATRCIVRGNIGYWEAHDQIAAAQEWASKPYVDGNRIAIWGWSYGGYLTLKTLEQDAGRTFRYGMAVAPVIDWRFYDSIYTERWMDTPQANMVGYRNASVHNVTALAQNTRFLLMHGVADDNVHFQNSLTLLDELDLEGIENYDVHVFPDSDHSISFDGAHRIVMDKLEWWLVNAFNGEWERLEHPAPIQELSHLGTG